MQTVYQENMARMQTSNKEQNNEREEQVIKGKRILGTAKRKKKKPERIKEWKSVRLIYQDGAWNFCNAKTNLQGMSLSGCQGSLHAATN